MNISDHVSWDRSSNSVPITNITPLWPTEHQFIHTTHITISKLGEIDFWLINNDLHNLKCSIAFKKWSKLQSSFYWCFYYYSISVSLNDPIDTQEWTSLFSSFLLIWPNKAVTQPLSISSPDASKWNCFVMELPNLLSFMFFRLATELQIVDVNALLYCWCCLDDLSSNDKFYH